MAGPKIRRSAPEVIQSSAMDCGPAALKSLLEGFGVSVNYGRLREACQTDVDGTSIDTIEEVAVQLGLDAEQIMVPRDHILLPEAKALPAIAVVCLPNGVTHFVVVWKRVGTMVQLMDPGTGRRWMMASRFLDELYIHRMPVPAAAWREWAESDAFTDALQARLKALGVGQTARSQLLQSSLGAQGHGAIAALDAATRMGASLVRTKGIRRGKQATRLIQTLCDLCKSAPDKVTDTIPGHYWSAMPFVDDDDGDAQVLLQGAVLVRAKGLHDPLQSSPDDQPAQPAQLSPELVAALNEKPLRPARRLLKLLREDGFLTPLALTIALFLSAGGVLLEGLLFRGVLDVGRHLGLMGQRLGAVAALIGFLAAMLLLELPIWHSVVALGRRLETRFRVAFLRKIPLLGDRYFASRLISDMAERSHSVHHLKRLPLLVRGLLQSSFALILTTLGIIWLDPNVAHIACLTLVTAIGVPLMANSALSEGDLRVRSHAGALSRFYLDGLLGLTPIRTHGAEQAVRGEHEGLLTQWSEAGLRLQRRAVVVQAVQALIGFGLAAWLLIDHNQRAGVTGGTLLLVYWALSLPVLGESVASAVWAYPQVRSITVRLMEPLGAPETQTMQASSPQPVDPENAGMAIDFSDVALVAAGHTILEAIDLRIGAGEHLAIVGSSGAGKSSLVGMLLGWHRPASGAITVDGNLLTDQRVVQLRRETAWVDPTVQLWNRSLLENIRYGTDGASARSIGETIENATLKRLLEKLPDGMQTVLGEGGALVSGGEGQRVRLARALLKPGVRLVILDEPFRGLDREQRRVLIERVRDVWKDATLLCITHDVGDTLAFERVVVVEAGQIVEDGSPASLAETEGARYRTLLKAEEQVRQGLWTGEAWRHLWLEGSELKESSNGGRSEH